jgi:hypothetical protein
LNTCLMLGKRLSQNLRHFRVSRHDIKLADCFLG